MLDVFEELSEPSRRHLLRSLLEGPRNVSQLVESTGLKQPNVSNHLARLRAKGWVRGTKMGRQVYYSLARADVDEAIRDYLKVERANSEELNLPELAKEYAKAAIKGNELVCAEIVERVLRTNHGILPIYQTLLGSAMTTIGTWYKVEAIDEAQEHMASAITERMTARVSHFYGPTSSNGLTALLACAPNNWHAIGLRMIADYLKFAGWNTIYVGTNAPTDSLAREIEASRPQLVMLSCASMEGVPDTLETIKVLARKRSKNLKFLIGAGGPAVQMSFEQFVHAGMDFSAKDLSSFANEVLPNIESAFTLGKEFSSLMSLERA